MRHPQKFKLGHPATFLAWGKKQCNEMYTCQQDNNQPKPLKPPTNCEVILHGYTASLGARAKQVGTVGIISKRNLKPFLQTKMKDQVSN
jgi:hypothetical protein